MKAFGKTIFFCLLSSFLSISYAVTPLESDTLDILNKDHMSDGTIDFFRQNWSNRVPILRRITSGSLPASAYQTSNAVFLLGKLGDTDAVDELEEAIQSPDDKIRLSALRALGRIISTDSTRVLIAHVEKNTGSVGEIMTAVDSFKKLQDPQALPLLEDLRTSPLYTGSFRDLLDATIEEITHANLIFQDEFE